MKNTYLYEGWRGFTEGSWVNEIDLRSFIRHNFRILVQYNSPQRFFQLYFQNSTAQIFCAILYRLTIPLQRYRYPPDASDALPGPPSAIPDDRPGVICTETRTYYACSPAAPLLYKYRRICGLRACREFF